MLGVAVDDSTGLAPEFTACEEPLGTWHSWLCFSGEFSGNQMLF